MPEKQYNNNTHKNDKLLNTNNGPIKSILRGF